MSRTILFALAFTQFTFLGFIAVAAQARDREPVSIIRLQNRQDSVAVLEGSLSCKNDLENSGAPCTLLFQANGSDRILNIAGNKNSAMRLYLDGTRNVSIEGPITGSFFRIEKIHALN